MKRFLIIALTQLTIVQYGSAYNLKDLLFKPEYFKTIYSDSTKKSKKDSTLTLVSDTAKVNLNFLKAPSSPAANLLGFSPSEVQSPSDPAAFIAHFQAPSNNFTTLPKSFAVDISPFWFFGAKKRTFTEYLSDNNLKNNFLQSLVCSIAYRDSSNALKGYKGNSFLSFGGKFSILRGKPKDLDNFYKKFNGEAKQLLTFIKDTVDTNTELINRRKSSKTIRDKMKTLLEQGLDLKNLPQQLQHLDSLVDSLEDSLKFSAVKVFNSRLRLDKNYKEQKKQFTNEIVREGFKWDIAGGYSYRYNQNNVDSSKIFKRGIWTTLGYEKTDSLGMGHWSFLSMARYLTNPEQPWADEKGILKGKTGISTFDLGIKIAYLRQGQHTISASTEVLYRSIASKQDEKSKIEPSWRFAFNANYEVSKNVVLTLAIGRDFDGAISKNGNVFAFLNLITAFGEGANVKK